MIQNICIYSSSVCVCVCVCLSVCLSVYVKSPKPLFHVIQIAVYSIQHCACLALVCLSVSGNLSSQLLEMQSLVGCVAVCCSVL